MKGIISIAAFIVCILLVCFSIPAMEAARDGVDIWWNTLLPTLLPFFACATLIEKSGALHGMARLLYPLSRRLNISYYALPLLFLGGITGYPSGARLCGMLQAAGSIGDEEAERLGAVCNLCSPMFLAGALAGGMLRDASLFVPLAVGYYAGALVVAALMKLCAPIAAAKPRRVYKVKTEPFHRLLPKTLANCMADITKVGGSVIFFLVMAELINQTGLLRLLSIPIDSLFIGVPGASPAKGLLLGLLEMTGGCHLIADAGLPIQMALPLCAFLVSFGGFSIMVQAMAFVHFTKPRRYILTKLLHACISAGITYLLVLHRVDDGAAVFASSMEPYAINALSGLFTLLSCALGVGVAFIAGILAAKRERC